MSALIAPLWCILIRVVAREFLIMAKKYKPLHSQRISVWPVDDGKTRTLHLKVLQLIGEVVADWAAIEEHLATLLAKASRCPIDSAVIILYALNSFTARLSVVKAAVQHSMNDHPDQEMILRVLAKLRDLNSVRNDLIHSSYVLNMGKKATMMRKTVRSERAVPVKLTKTQTGEIETHLTQLMQARQFFHF